MKKIKYDSVIANFGQARTNKYRDAFYAQKGTALNRGIEWHFTFEEWIDWWGDDIDKRGRSLNDLVMARTGDTGPYHPSNVRKATVAENQKEMTYYSVAVMTPRGRFNSIAEAAIGNYMCKRTMHNKLTKQPKLYYRIAE